MTIEPQSLPIDLRAGDYCFPLLSEAARALWKGESISVEGIAGSSCALAVAALFQQGTGTLIIVTPTVEEAETIADDITLFLAPEYRLNGGGLNEDCVLLFPPMPQHDSETEPALLLADESFGERVKILKRLASCPDQRLVVAVSMPALLQPVSPPDLLKERTQTLTVNDKVDLESLCRYLIEGGYHSTSAVDLPGEFALRGYILDLFAPDWEQPVRIELFNDEIKSIRRFDLTTQRSLEKLSEIDLTRLQPHEAAGASLLDYILPSTPIGLIELAMMRGVGV